MWLLLVLHAYFGFICHTDNGTRYGEKAVNAYAETNHGPDGSLFLDPYFKPDIEHLEHQTVLDAGCGAGPWSIYAAKQGGEVYAIDIQEEMIQAARKAVQIAGVADQVTINQGDVARLPYEENFFDKVISICVGCNLPFPSFEKHFSEIQRTLKDNGIAIIGAPSSLDVVFSNGSKTDIEVFFHIQEVLNQLPDNPSSEEISEKLNQLEEVLSASFYIKNNRLSLIANEKGVTQGEKIWRKLSKLVVPNHYYSNDFYVDVFDRCGFDVQKIDLPHFTSENSRLEYNEKASPSSRLGRAYVTDSSFIIFHIKKRQQ